MLVHQRVAGKSTINGPFSIATYVKLPKSTLCKASATMWEWFILAIYGDDWGMVYDIVLPTLPSVKLVKIPKGLVFNKPKYWIMIIPDTERVV